MLHVMYREKGEGCSRSRASVLSNDSNVDHMIVVPALRVALDTTERDSASGAARAIAVVPGTRGGEGASSSSSSERPEGL